MYVWRNMSADIRLAFMELVLLHDQHLELNSVENMTIKMIIRKLIK